ncbi:MAG TPA: hypothetical protein VN873_05720 [Candidatus Angelobacter sp.]|nr:hypothetical protein [Candidatus Angelobacter sp.]
MIKITTSMKFDGFSDDEIRKAKEAAIKEELRKRGLSHLTVKSKGGDEFEIEGGSETDITRAEDVLGGGDASTEISKSEIRKKPKQ